MSAGAYSDLKAVWHLDKIAALRRGEQIVPAQVQLVISDLCNHDCSFCAYRMSGYTSNADFGEKREDGTINNNPNRMISIEKCGEIIKDCARLGVGAMQFTGGGEPTVHPDHIDIIANAQHRGMETALVTNGAILRDGWEDVFPKLAWLRVSLDAATAKTYAEIRKIPESAFQQTLDHVEMIADHFHAVGAKTTLGLSYVVTQENKHEVYEAAILAQGMGVPSIRFAAMFGPHLADYYSKHDCQGIDLQIELASKLNDDGFQVIGMFSSRYGDLEQGAPDYKTCYYQEFNCYIGADLNVYRCCNTAYNELGRVGSLKEQSFAEFWQSPEKEAAYGGFDARACEHCAFNGKNRLIHSMAGEAPTHAAFV